MKKFTLLLAAALSFGMANAKTVTLWEGSVDFNTTSDYEIKGADYSEIEYGDKLVFHFTDVSTDEENPGQLCAVVKGMDSSWTWTEFVKWENIVDNKFEYEFVDEVFGTSDFTILEDLKGRNLLIVKGKNATLTSIDLVTAADVEWEATTIFEGSVAFGNWAKQAKITADKFAKAKVGDKIRFYFTDATGGQIQLAESAPDAASTWTKIVDYADIVNDKFTYDITDALVGENEDYTFLEIAKKNGLTVGGQKATFVKAELLQKAGEEPTPPTPPAPVEGTVIWEGSESLDGNEIEITGKFANLEYGDKIVCTFADVNTDPENPGQVTLVAKDMDANWTWTEFVAWQDIENDTYSYTLVDECFKTSDYTVLEMLQGRDLMIVKGKNATLKTVSIVSKGSGIEKVKAEASIDFNAPVEIYTIDGRRVAEMEKGRIYIVRQGANVVKMVK